MGEQVKFTLETLRVIHSMSLEEFAPILEEATHSKGVANYSEDRFIIMRNRGVGTFLMDIDEGLANTFINYANEKIANRSK